MARARKKKRGNFTYVIGALISIALIAAIVMVVKQKDEKAQQRGQEVTQEKAQETTTKPTNAETKPAQEATEPQKPERVKTDANGYVPGQELPTEPTYIDNILIASKIYPLPSTFAPGEQPEARQAFEKLAQDARTQGFELVAFSGYRSFEYQKGLYDNYVNRDGQEAADRYSARPGYSEHQTGYVFDIGELGKEDIWLTEAFGESPAGKWLAANAHKYGFIMRYPKGKEAVTGYMYESWHFRYVGVDIATKIYNEGGTLEEYLNI